MGNTIKDSNRPDACWEYLMIIQSISSQEQLESVCWFISDAAPDQGNFLNMSQVACLLELCTSTSKELRIYSEDESEIWSLPKTEAAGNSILLIFSQDHLDNLEAPLHFLLPLADLYVHLYKPQPLKSCSKSWGESLGQVTNWCLLQELGWEGKLVRLSLDDRMRLIIMKTKTLIVPVCLQYKIWLLANPLQHEVWTQYLPIFHVIFSYYILTSQPYSKELKSLTGIKGMRRYKEMHTIQWLRIWFNIVFIVSSWNGTHRWDLHSNALCFLLMSQITRTNRQKPARSLKNI